MGAKAIARAVIRTFPGHNTLHFSNNCHFKVLQIISILFSSNSSIFFSGLASWLQGVFNTLIMQSMLNKIFYKNLRILKFQLNLSFCVYGG